MVFSTNTDRLITLPNPQVIPVAFAFMERRTTKAYKAVIKAAKRMLALPKTRKVVTDWEVAMRNGWHLAYGRWLALNGCVWHYQKV